jgi:hypothetical protein
MATASCHPGDGARRLVATDLESQARCMRMIVHAGLHRAASSALQRTLGAEMRRLARRGVRVVRQQDKALPEYRATQRLLGRHVRVEDAADIALGIERTYAATEPPTRALLFSDENLFGPMLGRVSRAHPEREAVLEVLAQCAERHEVHLVLLLREHVAWLQSLYKFQLTKGDARSLEAFLGAVDMESVEFAPLIEAAERRLGKERVHVFAFESVAADAGAALLATLARLAGEPSLAELRLERRNASAPEPLLPVVAGLIERGVHVPGATANEAALLAHEAMRAYRGGPGDMERGAALLDRVAEQLAADTIRLPLALHRKTRDHIAAWLRPLDRLGLLRGITKEDARAALEDRFALWREGRLPPLLLPARAGELWQRFTEDRRRIEVSRLPEWRRLTPPADAPGDPPRAEERKS